MNKAIILLSGGLDSVVSLAVLREKTDIELAITFDYGQKSFNSELLASEKITKYYKINHKIISMDWLKDLTSSTNNSLWIPNRNALFINIAACYCDRFEYQHIIIGANKEEAQEFKDNSDKFITSVNNSLKNSTINTPKVLAPLINMDKTEIVKTGLEYNIPFDLLYSCYSNNNKHCGECDSCIRLKRALELNNRHDIITDIFKRG